MADRQKVLKQQIINRKSISQEIEELASLKRQKDQGIEKKNDNQKNNAHTHLKKNNLNQFSYPSDQSVRDMANTKKTTQKEKQRILETYLVDLSKGTTYKELKKNEEKEEIPVKKSIENSLEKRIYKINNQEEERTKE